jgi:hypothetical protein
MFRASSMQWQSARVGVLKPRFVMNCAISAGTWLSTGASRYSLWCPWRCWRQLFHEVPSRSPTRRQCARSPFRIVEQTADREVDWINRYLDYECLRRVAPLTLRSYAQHLLHFLR